MGNLPAVPINDPPGNYDNPSGGFFMCIRKWDEVHVFGLPSTHEALNTINIALDRHVTVDKRTIKPAKHGNG